MKLELRWQESALANDNEVFANRNEVFGSRDRPRPR